MTPHTVSSEKHPSTSASGSAAVTSSARDATGAAHSGAVWIVDDDPSIRFVLEKALAREQLDTRSFPGIAEVTAAMRNGGSGDMPSVVVSDIRMPGGSGIELLASIKQSHPELPVIVMTAFSDLDSAVAAFQGGAFEYLPKPFDVTRAVDLIHRALEQSRRGAAQADKPVVAPELLGQAPAMQEVFRAIGRLSQSQVTVLITGESGTGKELIAQALHRHSPRADGPFVAINTAAIPKDLLESELFGHERGAFTGAQALRRGRFEQAEGGTLFLDEIGDMPFELQTRLLRVLADGKYYRVGGHQPLEASVRVIAATHQNLEQRVRDGAFREDLFHRLNVIRLRLPPLRERREDVPALARSFMVKAAKALGVDAKRLSPATLEHLQTMSFPGNVRQLDNLCHWLTVMAPASVIEPKDLPREDEPMAEVHAADDEGHASATPVPNATSKGHAHPSAPGRASAGMGSAVSSTDFEAAAGEGDAWTTGLAREATQRLQANGSEVWNDLTRQFEATLIRAALAVTRGRRIEAAQRLGIGRNTITRKIQELGLDDEV
jgi:two-component system, NtrC family, nitrogen regulation response regulator GlnG